ncbi:MAG: DUF2971 domain-containing protein [Candidatus Acidiferrales bacterium]
MRIKLSEVEKLNDPFELWCFARGDRQIRAALRNSKEQIAQSRGMLCFSRRWHNPVLWSHYAEGHRGICLGFDVSKQFVKAVMYVSNRPSLRLPTGLYFYSFGEILQLREVIAGPLCVTPKSAIV